MMPQMDGIETTQKLRASGYKGIIVALTANALMGNNEMFAQNGFDGFISKPINVLQLNEVLNKFVRDRHPEEAVKYKPELAAQTESAEIDPRILQCFCNDSESAIVTLRESLAEGDLSLFITTAHGMKSVLANVDEHETASLAEMLENAAQSGDMDYITGNIDEFVETLKTLISKYTPLITAADNTDITEDTEYLANQMQIIKSACENYDVKTAYDALDRLKDKPWKPETAAALEAIRNALYIHSDFSGAASMSGELSE
jgi:CheY-like chemotaxis protein